MAYSPQPQPEIVRAALATLPLRNATWTAYAYEDVESAQAHIALVLGDVHANGPALVRIHSECLTGDVFGSERCDCGAQLSASIDAIAADGAGALVYIRNHEGRGIGLVDKLRAYALQDKGLDTVDANLALGLPADKRDYRIAGEILDDLGIRRVRILTNNPDKERALERHGIQVTERVPIVTTSNRHNARYLETKKEKLGHLL